MRLSQNIIEILELEKNLLPYREKLRGELGEHILLSLKPAENLEQLKQRESLLREWLAENPDAIVISDDPERSGISDAVRVRPSISALCELANNRLDTAINPLELKISYYRAPQGVS